MFKLVTLIYITEMQSQNKSKKRSSQKSDSPQGFPVPLELLMDLRCELPCEPVLPPLSDTALSTSLVLKILKFKGINASFVCFQLGANEIPGIHFQVICHTTETQ